jgi:hypothetical protein
MLELIRLISGKEAERTETELNRSELLWSAQNKEKSHHTVRERERERDDRRAITTKPALTNKLTADSQSREIESTTASKLGESERKMRGLITHTTREQKPQDCGPSHKVSCKGTAARVSVVGVCVCVLGKCDWSFTQCRSARCTQARRGRAERNRKPNRSEHKQRGNNESCRGEPWPLYVCVCVGLKKRTSSATWVVGKTKGIGPQETHFSFAAKAAISCQRAVFCGSQIVLD